jgi:hypothetical protein
MTNACFSECCRPTSACSSRLFAGDSDADRLAAAAAGVGYADSKSFFGSGGSNNGMQRTRN